MSAYVWIVIGVVILIAMYLASDHDGRKPL